MNIRYEIKQFIVQFSIVVVECWLDRVIASIIFASISSATSLYEDRINVWIKRTLNGCEPNGKA